ncbi:TetR/AcrR family transcriptional regulator [Robertmurraya sp. Marseille-Q9965]
MMTEMDETQLIGSLPIIPKQARAHEKRDALLKSGRILFIEKGYDQTNAKEIAQHAGVATGTFYRYFSDKRQLLMSILEDKLESLLPPEPLWSNVNPEEYLSSLLEDHFNRLKEKGIHRVLPELLHRDPELAKVLINAKKNIVARIYMGLEKAKEQDFTWQDLNLETVSWTVMSILEKLPEMYTESGTKPNFDEISKIICRLVFPPEKIDVISNLKNN